MPLLSVLSPLLDQANLILLCIFSPPMFRSSGRVKVLMNLTFFKWCSCARAKLLQSCLTLCDPWTVALQASRSMGFSRQEYWIGLPCPPPGDLPDLGSNLLFSLFFFPNLRLLHLLHWQAGSLLLVPPGKPL